MMAADLQQAGTDRIEKQVTLRAKRSRVWRALANAEEFGSWFGIKFDGPFAEGAVLRGQLTIPPYEHITLEFFVERIQPEDFFSYRWHPGAIKQGVDYAAEPTTLVEFRLVEADGSTTLTVVESGFDRLPASRRAEAFRGNESGWTQQMKRIERHVANG